MTPNVSPQPRQPRPAVTTPNARSRQNQIIALAIFVVVLVLLVRACAPHANKYERTARDLTQGIADGNLAAVQKLENSGTAADMPRARFGAASDRLSKLGRIERVHEVTPKTDPPRVHEFDVTFEKATVHETIEFDPDDKVFHFAYKAPVPR